MVLRTPKNMSHAILCSNIYECDPEWILNRTVSYHAPHGARQVAVLLVDRVLPGRKRRMSQSHIVPQLVEIWVDRVGKADVDPDIARVCGAPNVCHGHVRASEALPCASVDV